MNALKDTEIGEIIKTPQDTSQVSPQVNLQVEMLDRFAIDSRCNFSNKLTITWRLFGESADYLAISELSARLLGHNWVRNGSNRLKIMNFKYSKATQQESLCPLRSLWINAFSAPAHGRAPPQPAPAVHLRSSRAGG